MFSIWMSFLSLTPHLKSPPPPPATRLPSRVGDPGARNLSSKKKKKKKKKKKTYCIRPSVLLQSRILTSSYG